MHFNWESVQDRRSGTQGQSHCLWLSNVSTAQMSPDLLSTFLSPDVCFNTLAKSDPWLLPFSLICLGPQETHYYALMECETEHSSQTPRSHSRSETMTDIWHQACCSRPSCNLLSTYSRIWLPFITLSVLVSMDSEHSPGPQARSELLWLAPASFLSSLCLTPPLHTDLTLPTAMWETHKLPLSSTWDLFCSLKNLFSESSSLKSDLLATC